MHSATTCCGTQQQPMGKAQTRAGCDKCHTARTWSAKEKLRRPADSRTTERGMVMRAVAITRASSSPLTGCWPWPFKGTSHCELHAMYSSLRMQWQLRQDVTF